MKLLAITAALFAATPAAAEVVSANANGFEVRHSVNLVIPQAKAYLQQRGVPVRVTEV